MACHHGEYPHASSQVAWKQKQVSISNEGELRTDIVGSIAVIIYAAEKRCCCVLANILPEKMSSPRMFVHETFQVMNEPSNA